MLQTVSFHSQLPLPKPVALTRNGVAFAHALHPVATTPHFGAEKMKIHKGVWVVVGLVFAYATCTSPMWKKLGVGSSSTPRTITELPNPSATDGGAAPSGNAPPLTNEGNGIEGDSPHSSVAGTGSDSSLTKVLPKLNTDTLPTFGPNNPLNWDNSDKTHKLAEVDRRTISHLLEPVHTYVWDLVGTKTPADYFTVRKNDSPVYLYTAIKVVKAYYYAYGFKISDKDATQLLCQQNGIDLKSVKRDFAFNPGQKIWVKRPGPNAKKATAE